MRTMIEQGSRLSVEKTKSVGRIGSVEREIF